MCRAYRPAGRRMRPFSLARHSHGGTASRTAHWPRRAGGAAQLQTARVALAKGLRGGVISLYFGGAIGVRIPIFDPPILLVDDSMKSLRSASVALACIAGITICSARVTAQIVSPTGEYPPPLGVPLFDLSNEYGRQQYWLYMNKQHIMERLHPIYARHIGEPAWVESWQYLLANHKNGLPSPLKAENGDVMGLDNDGLGSPEPVFVEGYYLYDGSYVPSQFRALPGFGEPR